MIAAWLLTVWMLGTVGTAVGLALVARRHFRKLPEPGMPPSLLAPLVEVIAPLAGAHPAMPAALASLVEQDYPNVRLLLIVADTSDPAFAAAERIATASPRARIHLAGPAGLCARKNHSLVHGLGQLDPLAEIIVFCDGSNIAPPDWIRRMVAPIIRGESEVVTTHRFFDPHPPNLGGTCQAIYGSAIAFIGAHVHSPWGGGTAIRRRRVEELNLAAAWSRAIVDDIVLGNLLNAAHVPIQTAYGNRLRSPLRDHTVRQFVDFLDRQILFPKFTHVGMWLAIVSGVTSLALVPAAAILLAVLSTAGILGAWTWPLSAAALGLLALLSLILRSTHPGSISAARWLAVTLPCLGLAAGVAMRSIFRRRLLWGGVSYRATRRGQVLEARPLNR